MEKKTAPVRSLAKHKVALWAWIEHSVQKFCPLKPLICTLSANIYSCWSHTQSSQQSHYANPLSRFCKGHFRMQGLWILSLPINPRHSGFTGDEAGGETACLREEDGEIEWKRSAIKKVSKEEKVAWQERKSTLAVLYTLCTVRKLCTTLRVRLPRVTAQFVTRSLCPNKSLSCSHIEAKASNGQEACRESLISFKRPSPRQTFPRPFPLSFLSLL